MVLHFYYGSVILLKVLLVWRLPIQVFVLVKFHFKINVILELDDGIDCKTPFTQKDLAMLPLVNRITDYERLHDIRFGILLKQMKCRLNFRKLLSFDDNKNVTWIVKAKFVEDLSENNRKKSKVKPPMSKGYSPWTFVIVDTARTSRFIILFLLK